MRSISEDLIKVTRCTLLGELPDLFTFNDGSRVETPADWPKRRAEIYETAINLQFGTMPPQPEFLEVEVMYLGGPGKFNSYRVITGTLENPVTFTMMVRLPRGEGKFPAVVDGDLDLSGVLGGRRDRLDRRDHRGRRA